MKVSPHAGRAGRARDAGERPQPCHRLLCQVALIPPCRRSAWPSGPPGIAALRLTTPSTRHIFWQSSADIYKIYAESFRGADHLRRILEEARAIVGDTLAAAPGNGSRK